MPEDQDIQQAVESQTSTEEVITATRKWDICPAVDSVIAHSAANELLGFSDTNSSYSQGFGPYLPFRTLKKTSSTEVVVNAWMTNRSNIERVEKKFEKKITEQRTDLLSEWHPIVINSMPRPGVLRGIAPDKKKVAVLIALGKLSHENGLFLGSGIEMDSGQDVVFGGWEYIRFPGNGGGLAILLLLNV